MNPAESGKRTQDFSFVANPALRCKSSVYPVFLYVCCSPDSYRDWSLPSANKKLQYSLPGFPLRSGLAFTYLLKYSSNDHIKILRNFQFIIHPNIQRSHDGRFQCYIGYRMKRKLPIVKRKKESQENHK